MNPQRNNVKAGILVIGAIVLAAVTIIVLANSVEILGTRRYEVRFPLRVGAPGLQTGSAVKLGGQPVGTVWSIGFVAESGTGDPDQVRVILRIKDTVPLRKDAEVFLERPLLGSQSTINIIGVGTGDALGDDEHLDGQLAPPALLAQAGYGNEQAMDVRSIIAETKNITARVDGILNKFDDADIEAIRAAIRNSRDTTANARDISEDIKGRYTNWADRVDEVMDSVPQITASAQARLDELRDLIDRGRAVIDDNKGRIDETVENARAVSKETRELAESLNTEGRETLLSLMNEGEAAVTRASESLNRVDQLFTEQTPNIRATMASARIAAAEMREATIEIRRTPWRLLFRPDTQELEHELLYESARRYAGAVSDLRVVADALQAISAMDGASAGRDASVEELLSLLNESFEQYRDAEDAFIRELVED